MTHVEDFGRRLFEKSKLRPAPTLGLGRASIPRRARLLPFCGNRTDITNLLDASLETIN